MIRQALPQDAAIIAEAVVAALGDALAAEYLGDSPLTVAAQLAAADDTQYSWRNALIAEIDGDGAGAIVGYDGARLDELRSATLQRIHDLTGKRPEFTADETSAGEFYIDSLAVRSEYQGKGIATQLVRSLCDKAAAEGHTTIGLLVSDTHPGARRLYEHVGFKEVERRPFLSEIMSHMQLSAASR